MRNWPSSELTSDASAIKNHLNVLRFKTIEKRTEEYNKFLLKRFFKDLRKTKYGESQVFLRDVYRDYFEGIFDQKEFAEAFSAPDLFADHVSHKWGNQDEGNHGAQENQHRVHRQGAPEPRLPRSGYAIH